MLSAGGQAFFPDDTKRMYYCFLAKAFNLSGLVWLVAGLIVAVLASRIVSALSLQSIAQRTAAAAAIGTYSHAGVLLHTKAVDPAAAGGMYARAWRGVGLSTGLCVWIGAEGAHTGLNDNMLDRLLELSSDGLSSGQ
eukprot:SAG31_NODE_3398_length_4315_cov_1.326850_3_plen_137_part_00